MSRKTGQRHLALWAVGGALMVSGAARADLQYTEQMTVAAGTARTVTTNAQKKGAQRTESSTRIGTYEMRSVNLTLCEKNQQIRLDPSLKIYTVAPWDAPSKPAPRTVAAGAAKPGEKAAAEPTTGKIILTTTVRDLGEEVVLKIKARHYMVLTRTQTSGCAGNADHTIKMEIWVGPDIRVDDVCNRNFDPSQAMAETHPDCKISFEQRGDTAAYTKAFKGLVLRQKMYENAGENAKVTFTRETTSLSQAKLDDALFAVPAGYKQVSEKEFQEAQGRAVAAAMQKDQGEAAGRDADHDADHDADDGKHAADDGKKAPPGESKEGGDSPAADGSKDGANPDTKDKSKDELEEVKRRAKEEAKRRAKKKFKLPF